MCFAVVKTAVPLSVKAKQTRIIGMTETSSIAHAKYNAKKDLRSRDDCIGPTVSFSVMMATGSFHMFQVKPAAVVSAQSDPNKSSSSSSPSSQETSETTAAAAANTATPHVDRVIGNVFSFSFSESRTPTMLQQQQSVTEECSLTQSPPPFDLDNVPETFAESATNLCKHSDALSLLRLSQIRAPYLKSIMISQ